VPSASLHVLLSPVPVLCAGQTRHPQDLRKNKNQATENKGEAQNRFKPKARRAQEEKASIPIEFQYKTQRSMENF